MENFCNIGLKYNIRITGWREGAKKISATKAIRIYSGKSLADAKMMIDKCLEGETLKMTVDSERGAINLVKALHLAGFNIELA